MPSNKKRNNKLHDKMKKNITVGFVLALLINCACNSQEIKQESKEVGTTNEKKDYVEIELLDYSGNLAFGSIKSIENFPSEYVRSRNVDIWLPDNYSDGEKYAVLYMHDGQMLFDAASTWNKQEWKVDEILGKLINNGMVKNTIVVAVWNHADIRFSDYFPQKAFDLVPESALNQQLKDFKKTILSDNYLKFLVEEVKPYVDTNFSTYTDPDNTFIAGSSMGGLISIYAISEYPKVFGGAACLSTHWIGFGSQNETFPAAFFSYMKGNLSAPNSHKIYFDYGTETLDAKYLPFQNKVSQIMEEKGYDSSNFQNLRFDGHDHSENSWNQRLDVPLKFLLKVK